MTRDGKNQAQTDNFSDHDLLITLRADVSSNHAAVLDGMMRLQQMVEDVKTGSNTTLMEHERRLRKIEDMVIKMDPPMAFARLNNLFEWQQGMIRDQKRDKARLIFITSAIGSGLTVLINIASQVFGIIHFKH